MSTYDSDGKWMREMFAKPILGPKPRARHYFINGQGFMTETRTTAHDFARVLNSMPSGGTARATALQAWADGHVSREVFREVMGFDPASQETLGEYRTVLTCPDERGKKVLITMDAVEYDRFKFKRSLSHREIVECEWALKPKCVCRCAGEFHGARRLPENAGVSQYEALPTTDPHRLQPKPEREADAKIRRYHRRFHGRPYYIADPNGNAAHPIRRDYTTGDAIEWCPICVLDGREKVA